MLRGLLESAFLSAGGVQPANAWCCTYGWAAVRVFVLLCCLYFICLSFTIVILVNGGNIRKKGHALWTAWTCVCAPLKFFRRCGNGWRGTASFMAPSAAVLSRGQGDPDANYKKRQLRCRWHNVVLLFFFFFFKSSHLLNNNQNAQIRLLINRTFVFVAILCNF